MDQAESPVAGEKKLRWNNTLTLVAGTLLAADLLLRYLPAYFSKKWPENGGFDSAALILAILAILPWIADHLSSAKLPGGFDLAFRDVERRQNLTERAIRQLRFIVDGFLTRFEYQHLLNIRDGQEYEVKRIEAGALAAELRRLRSLGLIVNVTRDRGVTDFTRADGQKRRIDNWFRLTPRGEEYLRMRIDNQRTATAIAEEGAVDTSAPLPEGVLDRTDA